MSLCQRFVICVLLLQQHHTLAGWRLCTTNLMGLPEFLMESTATPWSDESRGTLPTSTTRSPVNSWPVSPAGLVGMTFLIKIPDLSPPSTLPPTIEMPNPVPASLKIFTILVGPQTLAPAAAAALPLLNPRLVAFYNWKSEWHFWMHGTRKSLFSNLEAILRRSTWWYLTSSWSGDLRRLIYPHHFVVVGRNLLFH